MTIYIYGLSLHEENSPGYTSIELKVPCKGKKVWEIEKQKDEDLAIGIVGIIAFLTK